MLGSYRNTAAIEMSKVMQSSRLAIEFDECANFNNFLSTTVETIQVHTVVL